MGSPLFSLDDAVLSRVVSRRKSYKDSPAKSTFLLSKSRGLVEARTNSVLDRCGNTAIVGHCSSGHEFGKLVSCGRDYCPSCGRRGSDAHMRRYARMIPRVRQMESMGYFTVQFMVADRVLARSADVLRDFGSRVVAVLRDFGFRRGLRRWDWFGDPRCPRCRKPSRYDSAECAYVCRRHGVVDLAQVSASWHPHLNILVDAVPLSKSDITRLQQRLSLAVLGVWDADIRSDGSVRRLRAGLILNYSFIPVDDPHRIPKMLHRVRYIAKPTFLRREWDWAMVRELEGFRNSSWWGRWDGPPVWSLDAAAQGEIGSVVAVQSGQCPVDGSRIVWDRGVVFLRGRAEWPPGWEAIGGGYFIRVPDPEPLE